MCPCERLMAVSPSDVSTPNSFLDKLKLPNWTSRSLNQTASSSRNRFGMSLYSGISFNKDEAPVVALNNQPAGGHDAGGPPSTLTTAEEPKKGSFLLSPCLSPRSLLD